MKTCYIACALDFENIIVKREGDMIIGADKGYLTLVEKGIVPDIAIGDFDTYTGEICCDNVIRYPVKKDDTDSALAIKYAHDKGYRRIVVFGAIGASLDHTLANVSLCASYSRLGTELVFVDGDNVLFSITDKKIAFSKEAVGRISVFSAYDKADGVCEKGLLYTLDNQMLTSSVPLGISNEFTGEESEISVKNGTLLIYTSEKNYKNCLTRE